MNSAKSTPKFSKIEIITQRYIVVSIIIQALLCLTFAIATSIWNLSEIKSGVDCDTLDSPDINPNMGLRTSLVNGVETITPCYANITERLNDHAYWYLGLSYASNYVPD